MKKKILVMLIVLLIILSAFGCSKENISDKKTDDLHNTTTDTGEYDYVPEEYNFNMLKKRTCDVFIGKIVDAKVIGEDVDFPNYGGDGVFSIYTVEVEKTYLSHYVTKGDSIKVIGAQIEQNEDDLYAKAYDVGKSYILTGIVQPYENRPVIASFATLCAEIDDGKIIPISTPAEKIYSGIETVEQLENNADFIELCKSDDIFVSETFYDEEKELTNDSTATLNPEKSQTKQEVIETIREAIKVDSKVKMDISYDNYPNDETK